MSDKERWKAVDGYEGMYEVSTNGRVKSMYRPGNWKVEGGEFSDGKTISPSITNMGYPLVNIYKEGKSEAFSVHRLVALAFVPNPDNKPEVNHIDGVKDNNNVENLEWCTRQENIDHSIETGLCKERNRNNRGENTKNSILKNENIPFIRSNARQNGGEYTQKELGKMFGVTRGAIKHVLLGNTWTHI